MKLQNRFISILSILSMLVTLFGLFVIQHSVRNHNAEQLDRQLATHLESSNDFLFEVIHSATSNLDFIAQNMLTRQYFAANEKERNHLFRTELTKLLEQYLAQYPHYSEVSIVLPSGHKDVYVSQRSDAQSFDDFDLSVADLSRENLTESDNLFIMVDSYQQQNSLALFRPFYSDTNIREKDTDVIAYIKISLNLQAIAKNLSDSQILTSFHYGQQEIFDPDMAQIARIEAPLYNNSRYLFKNRELLKGLYIQSTQNSDFITDASQEFFWQALSLALLSVITIVVVSIITLHRTILRPLRLFTNVVEASDIDNYKAKNLSALRDREFVRLGASFNRLMERLQNSSRALKNQALTDELTGLPNRAAFYEIIRSHKNNDKAQRFCILFLDLDGFKQINDNHGHQTGDLLLVSVARKLEKVIRRHPESDNNAFTNRHDTVVRLGGDEFAIILRNDSQAEVASNRIIKELQQGFQIADKKLYTGVSIGISIYPEHSQDIDMLVQYADIAMYDAKRNGKMRYSTFSPDMAEWEQKKLAIETAIREGIEFNRFETHFQPKFNCETGEIIGVEALARLRDCDGQLISPASFIPIAQEYGVLEYITYVVTEQSCQLLQKLNEPTFGASINITPSQLNDLRLIVDIRKILHRYDIETSQIEFEVTEEELIVNEYAAKNNLEFIREFGFKTALDDFGAGYSSLGYLKKFRFDTLKLDQVFINTEDYSSSASIAVIRSIKALAITLGMDIIAEGVETQSQVDLMQKLGIRKIQGYYYSKPLSSEAFIEMYQSNKKQIESFYTALQRK